jgi:pyruvate/2-oxoglutarate dehydrogenase complex dihydrolipoamide dehydrogenase (E3) component
MIDGYDVFVIGAGSTGTNVAWYARDNGLSCAVVEAERVGGECSYWACILPGRRLHQPPRRRAAGDWIGSVHAPSRHHVPWSLPRDRGRPYRVEGLDRLDAWDNRVVTTAEQIPRRLLILGGGVVGVEMAQAYRRLGAEQVMTRSATLRPAPCRRS